MGTFNTMDTFNQIVGMFLLLGFTSSWKVAVDHYNNTPLHYASQKGTPEDVEKMVELGMEPARRGHLGRNACLMAAHKGNLETLKYLHAHFPELCKALDDNNESALLLASKYTDEYVMRFLVEETGADPTQLGVYRRTACLHAAYHGNLAIVKYLNEVSPASCDAVDTSNHSALHFASEYGDLKTVKWLVEVKEMDTDSRGYAGRTACLAAASKGKLENMEFLYEVSPSSCKVVDDFGESMYSLAQNHGYKK